MNNHKQKTNKTRAALLLAVAGIGSSTLFSQAIAQETEPQTNVTLQEDQELTRALLKHFEKRFFNRIEATSEQREKISKILESKLKLSRQNRLTLRRGMKDLTKMACDPKAKASNIEAKAHELQRLRSEMSEARLQTMLEVRALLSEDQLSKMGKRLETVFERRQRAFES